MDSLADAYEMTFSEHNMSLMLMFTLRSTPEYILKHSLHQLISDLQNDTESAVKTLTGIRKDFTSAVRMEQDVMKQSGLEIAKYLVKVDWNTISPALRTLYSFRKEPDFINQVPNQGDIKWVKPQEIAESAGNGFIQFLTEWYNE